MVYLVNACIYIAVFTYALFHFGHAASDTHYHADETGWTRASAAVASLVQSKDLAPGSWNREADGAYGNLNPQLGKLLFAIPILCGAAPAAHPFLESGVPFDPGIPLLENKARGGIAPKELLLPLRWVAVVGGAGLCLLCMAMVHRAAGRWAAILAGLVLVSNPVVTRISASVLTDIFYQFFLVATGLAAMYAAEAGFSAQRTRRILICALLAGCATACKYAGVLLLLPFLVLLLAGLRGAGQLQPRRFYATLAAVCVVTGGIPFLLNPYYWPDFSEISMSGLQADLRLIRDGEIAIEPGVAPPSWVWHLGFDGERKLADDGVEVFRLNPAGLDALRDYLWHAYLKFYDPPYEFHPQTIMPSLFALMRPAYYPLVFLRWQYYKEWLALSPNWTPPEQPRFFRSLRYRFLAHSLEPKLALVGIGVLMLTRSRRSAHGLSSARVAAIFGITIIAMVYATRLADFERYLVDIFILRGMAAAIGAAWILRFCASRAATWLDKMPLPQRPLRFPAPGLLLRKQSEYSSLC